MERLPKTLRLINAFSEKAHASFDKYLFFEIDNERHSLHIRKFYKLLYQLQTDQEKIWAKLYPNVTFNAGKYRKLLHQLGQHAEGFMAYQEFKGSPHQEELCLIRALGKPSSLAKDFEKKCRGLIKQLEGQQYQDAKTLRTLSKLYAEYKQYTIQHPVNAKKVVNGHFVPDRLVAVWENSLALEMLVIEATRTSAKHPKLSSKWLNLAQKEYALYFPKDSVVGLLLELRKRTQAAQSSGGRFTDVPFIYEVSTKIFSQIEHGTDLVQFSIYLLNQIGQAMANYLNQSSTHSDPAYFEALLQFYQLVIRYEQISIDGRMSISFLLNLVAISERFDRSSMIKEFLEDNLASIPEDFREDAFALIKGIMRFWDEDYEGALAALTQKKKFQYLRMDIYRRMFLIQTEYELSPKQGGVLDPDHQELLERQLTNLSRFLQRKREVSPLKGKAARYKAWHACCLKLILANGKEDLEALANELTTTRHLVNPRWLVKTVQAHLGGQA